VSAVTATDECPSILDTRARSAPDASNSEARAVEQPLWPRKTHLCSNEHGFGGGLSEEGSARIPNAMIGRRINHWCS
jgi:hypothetical protein